MQYEYKIGARTSLNFASTSIGNLNWDCGHNRLFAHFRAPGMAPKRRHSSGVGSGPFLRKSKVEPGDPFRGGREPRVYQINGLTRLEPGKAMSLEIRALEADALARELAVATGEDIDTAVRRAIEERWPVRHARAPPTRKRGPSLQAAGGPPFSAKRKAPRSGGWGAESRYGSFQVRDDGRAIRLGSKQRAAPSVAPRHLPQQAGEGMRARDLRCVNASRADGHRHVGRLRRHCRRAG